MTPEDLKQRTMDFALRVLKVVESLPDGAKGWSIGRQLVQSGTSVAANYRAATRAKSTPDFIHKLGTVEEECDETLFWLELIVRDGILSETILSPLMQEADELLAIVVSSIRTAKNRR